MYDSREPGESDHSGKKPQRSVSESPYWQEIRRSRFLPPVELRERAGELEAQQASILDEIRLCEERLVLVRSSRQFDVDRLIGLPGDANPFGGKDRQALIAGTGDWNDQIDAITSAILKLKEDLRELEDRQRAVKRLRRHLKGSGSHEGPDEKGAYPQLNEMWTPHDKLKPRQRLQQLIFRDTNKRIHKKSRPWARHVARYAYEILREDEGRGQDMWWGFNKEGKPQRNLWKLCLEMVKYLPPPRSRLTTPGDRARAVRDALKKQGFYVPLPPSRAKSPSLQALNFEETKIRLYLYGERRWFPPKRYEELFPDGLLSPEQKEAHLKKYARRYYREFSKRREELLRYLIRRNLI